MEKKLLEEVKRFKELTNLNETVAEQKVLINEGILEDMTKFFSQISDTLMKIPAVQKLKDFYEKAKKEGSVEMVSLDKFSGKNVGTQAEFEEITKKIVDKIEGGYYHPSFKIKGAKRANGKYMSPSSFSPMGDSGETMFGIDRKHGGNINTNAYGSQFWGIIDNAQKIEGRWPYAYRGGQYQEKLMDLASKIMYDQYDKNARTYLTKEARKVIESNRNLFFQFAYASWNGAMYFKKLSNAVNNSVKKGIINSNELYDVVMNARYSSGQSSKKIAKIDRIVQTYA